SRENYLNLAVIAGFAALTKLEDRETPSDSKNRKDSKDSNESKTDSKKERIEKAIEKLSQSDRNDLQVLLFEHNLSTGKKEKEAVAKEIAKLVPDSKPEDIKLPNISAEDMKGLMRQRLEKAVDNLDDKPKESFKRNMKLFEERMKDIDDADSEIAKTY